MSYEEDMLKTLALLEEQKNALIDTADSSGVNRKKVFDFACTATKVGVLLRKRIDQIQQGVARSREQSKALRLENEGLRSANEELRLRIEKLESASRGR